MNYGKLLAEVMPAVIENDVEYARTEEVFNKLMDKGENNLSPDEMKLFALLARLLEDYEQRTLPPLPDSHPRETLRFLMETNDLKQTDLIEIFGTQSTVSEVLSGKREISKNQARRLADRFALSVDAFI